MRGVIVGAFVAAAFVGGAAARADVSSGPTVGEKVAALKVAAVVGEHENKDVDYAAERKEKPTVYLFVRADRFDRPMARFMKTLDGAIDKFGHDSYVVAVWLTDDRDKSKDYLPKAQSSLKFDKTALTVHPGEKSGPEGWGINLDADLTVVVAHAGKTAATFGFVSVNDTLTPQVEKALKAAVEKK